MRRAVVVLLVLLMAAPVSAQDPPRRVKAALAAFALAASADRAQTTACLATGACREVNPILRPIAPHPVLYGVVGAGLDLIVARTLWHAGKRSPTAAAVAGWIIVAMRVIVVGIGWARLH